MLRKTEELLIAFCVLAITVIMNINVIMRHFFNSSWTPTEEVCLILVVIITFVGSSRATRTGMHLFSSLVFDIPVIPIRVKKILAIVISLVCSALCLVLVYQSVLFVHQNYASKRITPSLGIPFYTFYTVLPVSFLLMAWYNAHTVFLNIKKRGAYALAPEEE